MSDRGEHLTPSTWHRNLRDDPYSMDEENPMKLLIVCLSLLIVATTAGAVSEDGLGFAVDTSDGIVVHHTTSGQFQEVTIYLCILEPSQGDVAGWECSLEIEGDPVGTSWIYPAGMNVSGEDNLFQVGIGYDVALRPGTTGLVHIATWTAFVPDSTSVIKFYLMPYPGSTSFDGTAGYIGSNESLMELSTPGNYNYIADFQINGTNDAFQESTWTAVKELFR